ncbi:hypothetical protein [Actinoallomurus rhizosphaericola]|uniref:hypothetical protein n=1 Tax=Actinoallomurus rhizosphaericola TaxID=2952536 RepID=UPI002091796A|nr:hypothetical protein [Actinoallomurus rhizosphaericola]MCO5992422.1 hypothetical protein [Actinoallomurus rhizosphaericola]
MAGASGATTSTSARGWSATTRRTRSPSGRPRTTQSGSATPAETSIGSGVSAASRTASIPGPITSTVNAGTSMPESGVMSASPGFSLMAAPFLS